MKIKFLPPSPRAGEISHIDNATGHTLCAAGLALQIAYTDFRERLAGESMPAAQTGTAKWYVGVGQQSQQTEIKGACSTCGSTFCYQGPVEVRHVTNGPMTAHQTGRATTIVDPSKNAFIHSCGMYPEPIPADIWRQYVALKKKEVVSSMPADEAQMYTMMTKT